MCFENERHGGRGHKDCKWRCAFRGLLFTLVFASKINTSTAKATNAVAIAIAMIAAVVAIIADAVAVATPISLLLL